MLYLLRPQDTIKIAVKLESKSPDHVRYFVVVSCVGRQVREGVGGQKEYEKEKEREKRAPAQESKSERERKSGRERERKREVEKRKEWRRKKEIPF